MFSRRAQGAFEYILLLAGILLIVVVVITTLRVSVIPAANQTLQGGLQQFVQEVGVASQFSTVSSTLNSLTWSGIPLQPGSLSGYIIGTRLDFTGSNCTVQGGGVCSISWSADNTSFTVRLESGQFSSTAPELHFTAVDSGGAPVTFSRSASFVDTWPKYHRDLGNTGFSPSRAPRTNATKWVFSDGALGNWMYSGLVVSENAVFVGSAHGRFYALDRNTGAILWNSSSAITSTGTPALYGDMVYVPSLHGNNTAAVTAYYASNGTQAWNYSTVGITGYCEGVWYGPSVAYGLVFFVDTFCTPNKMYAVNASTGSLAWSFNFGGTSLSTPAVADGMVYATTYKPGDDFAAAFNATTGAMIWNQTFSLRGGLGGVAVADGLVFLGTGGRGDAGSSELDSNKTFALNASTGARVWNTSTVYEYNGGYPVVAYGLVFIGSTMSGYKRLYAFNETTGAQVWNFTGNGGFAGVSVADGLVFAGTDNNTLYAVNASTGAEVWRYANSGPDVGFGNMNGNAAIAGGDLFFVSGNWSNSGKVYAFGS
jgi:outer membrane protein assembly factor BamB